jgi:hypothetical protein
VISWFQYLLSECNLCRYITGRHTIDFTLILTAVAFKLTVSQLIPAVSYLTLLDKYVLMCFGGGLHSC